MGACFRGSTVSDHGIARFGIARFGIARFGIARFGIARFHAAPETLDVDGKVRTRNIVNKK